MRRVILRAWNWLTSMRTALWLLVLLAVAAIPGAVLPQRSLNATNVNEYLARHSVVGPWMDRLQLFDVFSSTWFIAIYLLLFISLVGCIIPRTWRHIRSMMQPVPEAPRVLSRMQHYASRTIDGEVSEILARAEKEFARWKVQRYDGEGAGRAGWASISAERGYVRELYNLVFHLGLLGILVTVASGTLLKYEGQVIVVTPSGVSAEGSERVVEPGEFCNTAVANYDSFTAGALVDGTNLTPFCLAVKSFSAEYLANGQASQFTSEVAWAAGEDITESTQEWETYNLQVNHPLRIGDDRVYLQGHGFAPTITVTWPDGESRTQTVQFQPEDATYFLSSGALRFDPPAGMYPDLSDRRRNGIALQGLFAPSAVWSGPNNEMLSSSFPAVRDPGLSVDIYRGDAGLDSGRGQSIFSLDQGQINSGELQLVDHFSLSLGDTVTLDDGTSVRFDAVREYVNLQVSHDPTQDWVLVSAVCALVGLAGSVLVKRRRMWVRVRCVDSPEGSARCEVEVAGFAKTDRAGWGAEHDRIARRILGLPGRDDPDFDPVVDAQCIRSGKDDDVAELLDGGLLE